MTRILTRNDVAAVLTLADCIVAVEEAFRGYGEGRTPPPQSLGVHASHGAFHIKAGLGDVFAAKINANFPGNPQRHGLPMIQGVIVVIDAERGTPLGILDSTLITTLRTAAATAVAASHLARTAADSVAIIGCGNQGRAQLEALTLVRPVAAVRAFDHNSESATRYASEMSGRLSIDVTSAATIDEAVAAADIIVTCTPSRTPLLDRRHFRPGQFIAGVGADNPDKHELSPSLLAASIVIPDILEQAASMGDLHHAIAAGLLTRDDIRGELAAVICGRIPGRTNEDETFVFDSTGTALQDIAAASVALTRANERGIGLEIALR